MKYFAVPLSDGIFKLWCLFCFPSTSQRGPATFQMLRGHPWPAAAILGDAEHPGTTARRQEFKPAISAASSPVPSSSPGQKQKVTQVPRDRQGPGFGGICTPQIHAMDGSAA